MIDNETAKKWGVPTEEEHKAFIKYQYKQLMYAGLVVIFIIGYIVIFW